MIRDLWDMMTDFRYGLFLPISMWFIVGIPSFFIVDMIGSNKKDIDGVVIEKGFSPSNQSTTIGMAYTNNGAAPVVATSGHPDEWSLIVNTVDGNYTKVSVSTNDYYQRDVDDKVNIVYRQGWISGIVYTRNIRDIE